MKAGGKLFEVVFGHHLAIAFGVYLAHLQLFAATPELIFEQKSNTTWIDQWQFT